jgi:hypothetical protein
VIISRIVGSGTVDTFTLVDVAVLVMTLVFATLVVVAVGGSLVVLRITLVLLIELVVVVVVLPLAIRHEQAEDTSSMGAFVQAAGSGTTASRTSLFHGALTSTMMTPSASATSSSHLRLFCGPFDSVVNVVVVVVVVLVDVVCVVVVTVAAGSWLVVVDVTVTTTGFVLVFVVPSSDEQYDTAAVVVLERACTSEFVLHDAAALRAYSTSS